MFNRAHFEQVVTARFAEAQENGKRYGLLFIDLDTFKFVNDMHGHVAGDRVLAEVAKRLTALLPTEGVLARLGGDEFAVLLPLDGSDHPAHLFAYQVVSALAEPVSVGPLMLSISTSIGIARFPNDAQDYSTLLRYAELAMYAAKAASRNTFIEFSPAIEVRARHCVTMIDELRNALTEKQFVVQYQPQVDMARGTLIGFEALLRWNHPTQGLRPPSEFITIAEEQGLIGRIGVEVLNQSILQISRWRRVSGQPLRMAINVSAHQLRDRTLGARLFGLLEQYGLPASAVELEVTESILLDATAHAREVLAELRELGIRIVLDDLGVGYSSFAYLRQFKVDGVKLDRDFVSGLPKNSVDAAIARSIITLAHELNVSIIAEGVETTEQRDFLLTARCEYGQGFSFAKPLSSADVESSGWLTRVE